MDPSQLSEVMSKLSPGDRAALAAKLDKEMEEHMAKLEQTSGKYMDGWNEDNWEQEMQDHPFFANEFKDGQELSPLMKGIQDLKYSPDENTPEELAKNYKEDGNFNFKCKKYRFAVASYSEGLKARCLDELLNTQLLTNRAASQYHVGNFRSALIDCRLALAKTPNHFKAIVRGAECCMKLKRYQECQEFCDKGLELDSKDEKLVKLRGDAVKAEREQERSKRRKAALNKKEKAEEAKLFDAISARGITVQQAAKGRTNLELEDLEPTHPAALRKRVHFAAESSQVLVWPVLFLYPEFGDTDFIEAFHEDDAFTGHIEAMFGPDVEPPPWDQQRRYRPQTIKLYFEDEAKGKLVHVNANRSLKSVLSDEQYVVKGGTPGFIVITEGSKFHDEFLQKYK